jgi:hypothetical protein
MIGSILSESCPAQDLSVQHVGGDGNVKCTSGFWMDKEVLGGERTCVDGRT